MKTESPMEDWRGSLVRRLEQELPRELAAPRDRVRWIAAHLCEYVDRWVGFVEHPSVVEQPDAFAFESGMFGIIGVAVQLIESEIPSDFDAGTRDLWRRFVELHRAAAETHDLASRHLLLRLANDLLASLDGRRP